VAKKSRVFDLVARPFLDIAGQGRYLIPNTDVRLTFHKSATTFCLREHIVTAAAPAASRESHNIVFESAKLSLKKISVIPSILSAHMKPLHVEIWLATQ